MVFGFGGHPLVWLARSGRTGVWLGADGSLPFYVGGTANFGNTSGQFRYGGRIRYDFATDEINVQNSEAGIGIGGILGFKCNLFYTGASAEFIWAPEQGILSNMNFQVVYGLAFQFQNHNFGFDVWSKAFTDFSTKTSLYYSGTEIGLDLSFIPPRTNLILQIGTTGFISTSLDLNMNINAGFTVIY